MASVSQTLPDNQPPKRALIVHQFPRSEAQKVVQPKSDEYFGIPNVSQQANGGVTGKRLSEPRQVYDEVQLELDKQRSGIEMEFRGMMDKMQGMEKEKYKMELQLANKVAELETKVRNFIL